MIDVIKAECIIVNSRERQDSSLYIVFMIKDKGFIAGVLAADMRPRFGKIKLFYEADVSFYVNDRSENVVITEIRMKNPAESSDEPVF